MKRGNVDHFVATVICKDELLRVSPHGRPAPDEHGTLYLALPAIVALPALFIKDICGSRRSSFAVGDHPANLWVLVQYFLDISHQLRVVMTADVPQDLSHSIVIALAGWQVADAVDRGPSGLLTVVNPPVMWSDAEIRLKSWGRTN